jgi:type III pantothenate kinase
MRTLIVDNSNTRTKFAIADNGTLLDWRAVITTFDISKETLTKALQGAHWENSIISSVVPTKAHILTDFLSSTPCHLLNYQSKLPIGIDYPKPEQIGADRLANAAAAHVLYGNPAIVLDFGTAVTFDVITPHLKGVPITDHPHTAYYQGGVISPGLTCMTEGLARRTALLPHIQLQEPAHAIGTTTEEAMLSGAFYGYRGMIREIIHQLILEIPGKPIIVATGGDAPLITQGLSEIKHLAPLLTLEGLRIIAELNF